MEIYLRVPSTSSERNTETSLFLYFITQIYELILLLVIWNTYMELVPIFEFSNTGLISWKEFRKRKMISAKLQEDSSTTSTSETLDTE